MMWLDLLLFAIVSMWFVMRNRGIPAPGLPIAITATIVIAGYATYAFLGSVASGNPAAELRIISSPPNSEQNSLAS